MGLSSDAAQPNYRRPEAKQVQPDLTLIADLLGGTRQMWAQSAAVPYIRKWADEDQAVYDIRRQSETLFEGFARVLSAAVGMLFAKPPVVTWNQSEAAMTEHWANLDAAGTAGPVLLKRFSEQAIRDGLAVVVVDHPPAPQDTVVTQANERALGLRPRWALYTRAAAINWYDDVVANERRLTRLVVRESGTAPDGAFGVKVVERFRVLALSTVARGGLTTRQATWTVWQASQVAGMDTFTIVDKGVFTNRAGVVADFLPVAIAYTGRTDAPMCASLPLMGVAWANLAHWQVATDLRFSRNVAAFAQGVVVGEFATDSATGKPGKAKIGPLVFMHLVGQGATFDWKAPPVEAFAALERGMDEKLKQMGQQGMAFLVTDTRAAETATAKQLDATAENSTLATAGRGIDDAANLALEYHAWYLGIEKAGAPTIALNKDFAATVMEPAVMLAYIQASKDIGFPVLEFLKMLKAGGRLAEDTDINKLEAQMMADQAAIAEQQRMDAAAQFGAPTNGHPPARSP